MRTNKEIINEILDKRGITSPEDIKEFLSEKPKRTYDPFLLDGMQAGVDLLLSVARSGGRICIYGDYDADGVTSVVVMACGISRITDNWHYYIPSRFDEGYGLNIHAIDRIKSDGTELIITVDCGCVSAREVEYAKSIGLQMIVTDHHNIEDVMADCIVIDPKKPVDEPYPCADLAGCGVAFKFIQALQRQAELPKSILNEALDMVAIGTVGDIVPLKDENRTLVKYGIAAANSGRRASLAKLSEAISIDEITSENISFGIVPHINAAGRMASAKTAVELFLSTSEETTEGRIRELIHCNSERKRIQEEAYESCKGMISGDENFIILKAPGMHEGIAGIVAGKLKDRFNRPVIIVTPSEDEGRGDGSGKYLKGTGRSVPKVDIYEVLNSNSHLFERFGGHRSACGFLMKESNFDALVKGINEETENLLRDDPGLFQTDAYTDAEIKPEEINVALAKDLRRLAPFGEGNPKPRFIMRGAEIRGLSYMGENRDHARFSVCSEASVCGKKYSSRVYVNCVLFRRAQEQKHLLEEGGFVDLTGSLSYQVWKGQERVQFIVEEIYDSNK